MRKKLALAAVIAGVFGVFIPANSASAYCDPVLSDVAGRCVNGCVIVGEQYARLDAAAGGALPALPADCPA